MKKISYLFIILIISLFFACNNSTQNQDKKEVDSTKSDIANNQQVKLQIYYFHATHRCATCNSIETNVKKVLETTFKSQVAEGLIDMKVLCVDDEANKALVEKYEATGAALHLVKMENGAAKDNDLTDYAFSYSRHEPEVFLKGIKDTIAYLIK